MSYTRRGLGRLALSGLPAALAHPPGPDPTPRRDGAPDSRWGGVQVGMNVPSSFAAPTMPAQEIVARCRTLGISAIELGAPSIERALGAPVLPASAMPPPEDGFASGLHPLEEEVLQDEVDLALQTFAGQVRRWRREVSLTPLAALRREFDETGVRIEIVNWNGLVFLTDEEVDYSFRVAKALGAAALSTELIPGGPRRLGPFADRHEVWLAFHGDHSADEAAFEAAFSHGRFTAANLDLAQWAEGQHGSPLPFLEQHAGRVTHVHLNDRGPAAGFGEGDTAIAAVLAHMRDHQAAFQATLDLSPAGGDTTAMAGLASAIAYCRSCLIP